MLTLSLQPDSYDEVCRIVKSIMQIAIEIDHHPDVCFGYRSLLVRTITHDEGGITSKDFDCADRILKLITSLDLVELNPFLDDRGMTARLMVDLVASLMGRKVFDRPTRAK